MAVWDRRVEKGLERLEVTIEPLEGWYGSYIDALEELLRSAPAAARSWRPRDLDLALYTVGG